MNILAIDLGTYSIKFMEATAVKRELFINRYHEVILSDYQKSHESSEEIDELQYKVVKAYLSESEFKGKIIFQCPSGMCTFRPLELPTKSKRKADLMVPFQLEESLPFTLNNIHFGATYIPNNNGLDASISITQKDLFSVFHAKLEKKEIVPKLLTTESSTYQNYVLENNIEEPMCIVDIGHTTTKAFFFHHKKLISSHLSHVAGKNITEVIAKTYNTSMDDAVIYKHQNCYFLTKDQYDNVDNKQRDFALLMERVFTPLIADIKRWELGFRVNLGIEVHRIFLTGGSSYISNIDQYMAYELKTNTSFLSPQIFHNLQAEGLPPKEQRSYHLTTLMGKGVISSTPVVNLLSGDFVSNDYENLPLYSAAHMAIRTFLVAVLILTSLVVERFYLNKNNKNFNNKITRLLKKPELGISRREGRTFKKRPEKIYEKLKKRKREAMQEIRTLQASSKVNIAFPLVSLGNFVDKKSKVYLLKYNYRDNLTKAVFSSEHMEELDILQDKLKKSPLKITSMSKDTNKKELSVKIFE